MKTRDGREARIIYTLEGNNPYPVVAVIINKDGREELAALTKNLKVLDDNTPCSRDIITFEVGKTYLNKGRNPVKIVAITNHDSFPLIGILNDLPYTLTSSGQFYSDRDSKYDLTFEELPQ